MTHLPAGQRTIPSEILAHLREMALLELGDLLANLDAGNVELLDFSNVAGEDANGKPTRTRTYTVIVRKP